MGQKLSQSPRLVSHVRKISYSQPCHTASLWLSAVIPFIPQSWTWNHQHGREKEEAIRGLFISFSVWCVEFWRLLALDVTPLCHQCLFWLVVPAAAPRSKHGCEVLGWKSFSGVICYTHWLRALLLPALNPLLHSCLKQGSYQILLSSVQTVHGSACYRPFVPQPDLGGNSGLYIL